MNDTLLDFTYKSYKHITSSNKAEISAHVRKEAVKNDGKLQIDYRRDSFHLWWFLDILKGRWNRFINNLSHENNGNKRS